MTTTISGDTGVSAVQPGVVVPGDLSTGAPTWDASGNVGIGRTPSLAVLEVSASGEGVTVWSAAEAGTVAHFATRNTNVVGNPVQFYLAQNLNEIDIHNARGALNFFTAGAKRMTLDASGNLSIGSAAAGVGNNTAFWAYPAAGYFGQNHVNGTPAGTYYTWFAYNGTTIGSISQNGSTAIAFNTTSDYRLKENVRPADAKRFMDIEFVDFEWIDGRHDCGVIAHQLQSVYPDLVLGDKDAIDADGNPVYQQVNYTGLIGRIGARVQQLQRTVDSQAAIIEQLTARISALEAK